MSEDKPLITFQPVQIRPRHDGWTAERQIAFIEKLADCGSVTAAARHVGMSRESARQLRRHPGARAFRDAWDAALDCGYAEVEEAAMERSKNGIARPVFYQGELVGEWRQFDERLTMFLLRCYRPERYGRARELPAPRLDEFGEDLGPEDPSITLDGGLSGIEWGARDVPLDEREDGQPCAL